MSTIAQVVDALETTTGTVTGLHVYDHVPLNLAPPALVLPPPTIDFNVAMQRGVLSLDFTLYLFLSQGDIRLAQHALWDYLPSTGAKSIDAAIRGSNGQGTLGLTDTKANVLRFRPLGVDEIAAYGYLGGAWDLNIVTSGV